MDYKNTRSNAGVRALAALFVCFISSTAFVAARPTDTPEKQWWKGVIEVPGQPLDFVVVFTPEENNTKATMDIPVQGAKGIPLVDVDYGDKEMKFSLPAPANALFKIARSDDGTKGTGTMDQHGMTFNVTIEKTTEDGAKAVGPPRPQTPKPPFPYKQLEVGYENKVDNTHLAGTLTIPQGNGPHPAVILITGSGTQDRDSTIFGHKSFLVFADYLTRRGIACLRVDDRGIGGSTGATRDVTSADFAGDVLAGIEFLKKRPEIDPQRIGLIGHSEGGIIAPMVAVKSKDVKCIVMLAGSALPGSEILNMQLEASLRGSGWSEQNIARHSAIHKALIEKIVSGAADEEVMKAVKALVESELKINKTTPPKTEQVETVTRQQFSIVTSPWMRAFLKHDPRTVLRKVKCPVLALNGSLDLQVLVKENLQAIKEALGEAGNPDMTLMKMPGLNHLFQEAQTGMVSEYAKIQQTISPKVLEAVEQWLQRQFKENIAAAPTDKS